VSSFVCWELTNPLPTLAPARASPPFPPPKNKREALGVPRLNVGEMVSTISSTFLALSTWI
jgi:hypothetical protein